MFHGSMVAIVTPMDGKGQVDYSALSQLVDFHLQNQTDAILVVGTTGESGTLTASEHHQIICHVVEQVASRVPVIAGTGATGTDKTIEQTQAAEDAGIDACLLMAPAYVKPTQEGLFQHYHKIAHEVAVPQILYNVPGRTASDILPETVARLADCPNIVGIKEASGKLERTQEILALCGEKVDVYSGDDGMAKDIILAGGKGVISVTANVAPQQVHDLCAAALVGDRSKADTIADSLNELNEALFLESNPIPVKWALARMGLIQAGIRLPLTPLSKPLQSRVENALNNLGLIT